LSVHRTNYASALGIVNGGMREILVETFVANPSVGAEQANFFRYGFTHEALQCRGADVLAHAGNHVAFTADSASDDYFARSGPTGLPVAFAMSVLSFAADERFVNFNDAAQLVHVLLGKGGTDAMAHISSGLVGAWFARRLV
jgi:hypothetical protein